MKTQKSPGATGLFRNLSTNFLTSIKLSQRHCSLGTPGGGSQLPPHKRQTKTERAFMLMISTPRGVTENDILRNCRLISGRNYTNKLEKYAAIQLERIKEPNPDGIGTHTRYRIRSAQDAYRALMVVNGLRAKRGAKPLPEDQVLSLSHHYNRGRP